MKTYKVTFDIYRKVGFIFVDFKRFRGVDLFMADSFEDLVDKINISCDGLKKEAPNSIVFVRDVEILE